jgi:hypothetical protein
MPAGLPYVGVGELSPREGSHMSYCDFVMKLVMRVDMDAFFATVEERQRPTAVSRLKPDEISPIRASQLQ